jgi:nucleoside-diphosphate-sugar epimerase
MKKIVLIGHGYVGRYIAAELDAQSIHYIWTNHNKYIPFDADFIINAAGFTGVPNVDACELRKADTVQGNINFPLHLERTFGCQILHLTSGCVYTGYKDNGWTESDTPNFNWNNGSFYSATKAEFQKLWTEYGYDKKSYLLRLRMPFGPDNLDKNLLMKLWNYDRLVNFENSITYLPDLARAVVRFIEDRPLPGIYNAVNPGGVTTRQITEIAGINKPFYTTEEWASKAIAPRSNCVLNTDKMQAISEFRPADQALKEAIDFIRTIPI